MSYISDLSQSAEYLSFRSSIPLRKVVVDSDGSKVNTNYFIIIEYIYQGHSPLLL